MQHSRESGGVESIEQCSSDIGCESIAMTEQAHGHASSGRVDSASRLIRATPAAIYRAFVNAGTLVRWLPPAGMKARIDAFDPRVGGEYRITLTYDRHDHLARGKTTEHADVTHGRFLQLVPDREIVQTVRFESDDPGFAGEMRINWLLEGHPEGTMVHIRADNIPEGIAPQDHVAGFQATLANLAAFVER
jgi:uncharacterized protein YndB with AHSA1/START domain